MTERELQQILDRIEITLRRLTVLLIKHYNLPTKIEKNTPTT